MSPTDPSATFNLVEPRWIPVLRANGRFERAGIRRVLKEAGRIRQIAASNPMDNVALSRIPIAALMFRRAASKEGALCCQA